MAKVRVDELLVLRGLAQSRAQAKALVMAGKVFSLSDRMDKPGKAVDESLQLRVVAPPRYVSRGAEKLASFFAAYPRDLTGRHVLDVGASTGGFTDYVLQHGAMDATCIDVGRNQLHNKLVQDERVQSFEKVNARNLDVVDLPRLDYDLVVMDLSFISLRKVLQPVWNRVGAAGLLVMLVKPQFEARKEEVDAGKGIISDRQIHERVLAEVKLFCEECLPGADYVGQVDSQITGTDGNQEYLLGYQRGK